MIRLPGICIVCREPVVWNGKRWKDVGQRSGRHVCPDDRSVCGSWMPRAKEPCVRRPGHWRGDHRSAYALENARVAKSGRRAA